MLYHHKSANQFFGKEIIRSFDFWSRSSFFLDIPFKDFISCGIKSLIGCVYFHQFLDIFQKHLFLLWWGSCCVFSKKVKLRGNSNKYLSICLYFLFSFSIRKFRRKRLLPICFISTSTKKNTRSFIIRWGLSFGPGLAFSKPDPSNQSYNSPQVQ